MLIATRQPPSKLAMALFAALFVLAALLSWGGIVAFLKVGSKIVAKLACILGFAS